ncbi:MAG: phosphoesterase PA-phosphatase related [Massilia sp.]|nr:phosphoesterase PA-phosphatase related [Massilia sp.]
MKVSDIMHRITLPLCALAALLAGAANAAEPSFVSAEQTQVLRLLATPPAAGSATTLRELADLHRLEETRTAEQAAQAVADDKNETIFIYRNVIGAGFTAQALPATAAFSARVKNDEGINTNPAKQGFARVRPYNLDKSLHPICATKTKNDSYPSGHTTAGYILALSLIDMVPEKRDAILARADDYANNRLVCGVHYASDLEASKLLAYTIHAVMANNPQYQKELAVARLELRRSLGLPPASNSN